MFGQKNTSASIRHILGRAKHHITSSYHSAKNVLSTIDQGVNLGKQIYAAVQPTIDKYVGHNVHNNVMKGLGNYESLRNSVMESNESVVNNVNQVVGNLSKISKLKGLL